MNKTTIKIKGMSCGHCKMAVEKALKANDCVVKAEVDLKKEQALVEYKDCLDSIVLLEKAVEDAGYEVI